MFNRIVWVAVMGLLAMSSGCRHDSTTPALFDSERLYLLPYQFGDERFLIQGYHGPFGHAGFELDFVMPVGTLVLAARDGVVTGVDDSHIGNCPVKKDCLNNYVAVDHLDGTFADYLHIQQGGACVAVGQRVFQGDVIALSGNVGISVLPHLHLGIFPVDDTPPAFVDVNQLGTGIPRMGNFYRSSNVIKTNYCDDPSI